MQICFIIFKKWRFTISGCNSTPVVVYPFLGIVNPNVCDQNLSMIRKDRYDQGRFTPRSVNVAPIAIGLLAKIFMAL